MTSSNYNFVRFVNRGSKVGNYKVSINKSLSLGLLSGFYLKEGIKDFKKAVLFYDKQNKALAISFTNDVNAEGAFTVTHGKNTGSVSAHSFFIENELKQGQFWGQKIPRKERDNKLGTLYVVDLISK